MLSNRMTAVPLIPRESAIHCVLIGLAICNGWLTKAVDAQDRSVASGVIGRYEYEAKPDNPEFAKFFPRKAPAPGSLLLRPNDRLAIIGDSITEQKMYSRMIETYLTVCLPELKITARQYGWSGEKTDGFLRRMERDCLTFKPTIATICYGMNDARYRPFDWTNGLWYRDHYTAIVDRFKQSDVRVVVGSPGCAGKIASWVKSASGTLDEHNLHLCALRDVAMTVAEEEQVTFADIFWPMYQAQVLAPARYPAVNDDPYEVAGKDGIHPGWAGQTIMAYAFLRALGVDGEIGTITVDLGAGKAEATSGHRVVQVQGGRVALESTRYPYCADGPTDRDDSIRSGMTLVPFNQDLNRFVLKVVNADKARYRVTWGTASREYAAERLVSGVNLADEFPKNPFLEPFQRVEAAVLAKQSYETKQIKQVFHSKEANQDFERIVRETEAERQPLADAIGAALTPVEHTILIEAI